MDEMWEYFEKYPHIMYPKWWSWTVIGLSVVVFFGGLFGNALVCIALYRNGLMRTVTNYFLMNLAIADFMVILFCLPPSLAWDVTLTWFFGTFWCKVIIYLQNVSVTVSVLTLSFISMERWYAICCPLKFKSTLKRAKTAICVIWIIALALDIPEIVVYETVPDKKRNTTIMFTQCLPIWPHIYDKSWTALKMLLLYAIPLSVMAVMYFKIVKVLRISEKQLKSEDISENACLQNFSIPSASKRGQLKSRRKAAKMLASVVALFALCHLPVHTIEILRLMISMGNSDVNRAFSMLSHWLCYANSAMNPLIYNFMSNKFRREFKKSFEFCTKAGRQKRSSQSTFHEMNSLAKNRISSRKAGGSLFSRTDTITTKLSD